MRFKRRLLRLGVLAALAVCPVGLPAEQSVRETLNRVDVLLTAAPTLSTAARASMIYEAASIWLQARRGSRMAAADRDQAVVAANRLRALIVQKRLSNDPRAELAIGELVRPENGHPIALISIEVARAHGLEPAR